MHVQTQHAAGDEPLLTRKEIETLLEISRATVYRWLKTNPNFPKPVRLNPSKKKSAIRWRWSDIMKFIDGHFPSKPAKPADKE